MDASTLLARELAGSSPAMLALRERIDRIGRTSVPVLITGETGTGKTTAARLLHRIGERAGSPFVKVNCSGIPDTLIESEFFGHEKGAFTGALTRRVGLLPRAGGGTLFLDEIGDLSGPGQAKLLDALDDGEIRPVGGTTPIRVDFRLVSATSHDLDRAVVSGRFRSDLFHRIAVVRLHIPPLRDRREDLPVLARNALRRAAAKHRMPLPKLGNDALAFLADRPWHGNVRELAHLLEAALVLAAGTPVLDREALVDGAPERPAE